MDKVRILPLLVFAGLCLLLLKSMGLFFTGGYVFSGAAPASAQNEAASKEEKPSDESKPEIGSASDGSDTDASANNKTAAGPAAANPDTKETKQVNADRALKSKEEVGTALDPSKSTNKAERAILEGLSNRRKTLDKRGRELELRENLLKAAEKRVEAKIAELKAIESRIEGELKKRDDSRSAQYQRLVQMYSNMKPKDAARIFDRLELNMLTGLVAQMKPRVMSAILAAMTPSAAERLTLEIANTGKAKSSGMESLPKISSR